MGSSRCCGCEDAGKGEVCGVVVDGGDSWYDCGIALPVSFTPQVALRS